MALNTILLQGGGVCRPGEQERVHRARHSLGATDYGTSIKAVNDIAEKGRICVLDIEMEVWRLAPQGLIGNPMTASLT